MLSLSRKQMMVFFLILVSFIVALVASMAIIHVANPNMWQHVQSALPDVISHF